MSKRVRNSEVCADCSGPGSALRERFRGGHRRPQRRTAVEQPSAVRGVNVRGAKHGTALQRLSEEAHSRTSLPLQSVDSDLSDGPITVQEFLEVKNALSASEAKIKQLMKVNSSLSEELRLMQKKLQSLQSENTSLRRQVTANTYQAPPGGSEQPDPAGPAGPKRCPTVRGSRPMSMYETGSGLKPYLPKGEAPYPEESVSTPQPLPPHIGRGAFVTSSSLPSFPSTLSWSRDETTQRTSELEKQSSMPDSDYDNTANNVEPEDSGLIRRGKLRSAEPDDEQVEPDPTLPSTEDVIRKTEQITKNIQELLRAAQENKHESFIPCSERIHVAVTEMAALFPKRPRSETVRGSLRLLTSSAFRLQCECKAAAVPEGGTMPDTQLVTQQVIQCAYDIAKAAKQLVTITTKENSI
nr:ARF GTPase-activating protein GIT2 [Paramormyrops kingsleyae]